jgi:hypothetical protein
MFVTVRLSPRDSCAGIVNADDARPFTIFGGHNDAAGKQARMGRASLSSAQNTGYLVKANLGRQREFAHDELRRVPGHIGMIPSAASKSSLCVSDNIGVKIATAEQGSHRPRDHIYRND